MNVAVPFLFLAAAGTGALTRAVLSSHLNRPLELPWGTLLVNLLGCGAAGAATSLQGPIATVLVTGGLGALTTYSTFALELIRLARGGRRLLAAGYAVATVSLCIAGAALGRFLFT